MIHNFVYKLIIKIIDSHYQKLKHKLIKIKNNKMHLMLIKIKYKMKYFKKIIINKNLIKKSIYKMSLIFNLKI